MSNRDNSPELDYYELRRRHQEYKARKREEEAAPKAAPVSKPAPTAEPQELLHADDIQEAPVQDIPAEAPAEQDPLASLVLEDEEPYEDELEYEEEQGANPNPFDSFIRFFNGVKDNISARREAKEAAELDALDEDLTDEELAELNAEFDGLEDGLTEEELAELDAKSGKKSLFGRSRNQEEEIPGGEDPEFDDAELEDEPEEEAPRKGGLKRFLNLFVSRVDDEELELEEVEEDAPDSEGAQDGRHMEIVFTNGVYSEPEGGQIMDEMNKPVSDTLQQMAEGLETSGMSRRERRERAMRLAAEEAARKAAEEAELKAMEERLASAASAVEPLFKDADVEPAADAEPAAAEPVVEETPAEELPVEEPTREFTPVSLRNIEEEKRNLFDVSEDEEPDDDEEYEDDEDEEDEDEEETPRRGFFGFLRGRKRREDDDEDDDDEEEDDDEDEDDLDDEDDDEYEDDEDEEEDEDERPAKSRRGLFGRRRKDDDDEDEDDDDEYDDDEDEGEEEDEYDDDDEYEDEDDDDEYDEYEDDDEYDSYDDGKVHRSIGWHICGVLKWVLRILFVLLVLILALNILYFTGTENVVPAAHDAMGDTAAFHLLFFSYDVRQNLAPASDVPATVAGEIDQPTVEEPTAIPEPEATVSIPDFGTNGDGSEAPALDLSPADEGSVPADNA